MDFVGVGLSEDGEEVFFVVVGVAEGVEVVFGFWDDWERLAATHDLI